MERKLVVWYNPNRKEYYYKIVQNWFNKYQVGYVNGYDHIVVLVIDVCFKLPKKTLKSRVITRLISFLQKIE